MKFQGAVIKEQGVTFAVVLVKDSAARSSHDADRTRAGWQQYFPGMPIVLASQDSHGTLTYQGRSDLAKLLASLHVTQIPWKEYTTS